MPPTFGLFSPKNPSYSDWYICKSQGAFLYGRSGWGILLEVTPFFHVYVFNITMQCIFICSFSYWWVENVRVQHHFLICIIKLIFNKVRSRLLLPEKCFCSWVWLIFSCLVVFAKGLENYPGNRCTQCKKRANTKARPRAFTLFDH